VLFTDMRMPPGWDGLETSKKIRDLDKNIEIVIMTAYADHDQKTIAETVGTPEKLLYIKKPFQSEEIYQLALSLTSKWNFEETERQRKSWLETVIRSMSRVKTVSGGRGGDIYETALKSILTFTDANKGFISVWNEPKWVSKHCIGLEKDEADQINEENSQRFFESRTTQSFDGKYLIPLKREGYSAVVVLFNVVSKNDPEWYKLLSLLGMTASEALSSSVISEDFKKQEDSSSLSIAISKISNECKSHLVELLDYASLLKEVLKDNSNSSLANNIINSANFMIKQMNDMLIYSNAKDPEAQDVDIAEMILSAKEAVGDNKVKIELNADSLKDAKFSGDKEMLKDAFKNLFLNSACSASQIGKESVKINVSLTEEPKGLLIVFQDNCPGAQQGDADVFKPFSSNKAEFGLGLALTKQIIEKHKGSIAYDRQFSDGERFLIKLPKPKA